MVAETQTEFVDVRVVDVRRRLASGRHHMIVLEEIGGSRRLEIWVGQFEGEAIAAQLQSVEFARPLTFSFMASVLAAGGARLREVRVSRLVDDVFYAVAVVEGAGGATEVDARPSDALNLALIVGAPIRVAPAIFEATSTRNLSEAEIEERVRALVEGGGVTEERARERVRLRDGLFAPDAEDAAAIAAAIRGSSPGAGASLGPPSTPPE